MGLNVPRGALCCGTNRLNLHLDLLFYLIYRNYFYLTLR
ncbi:hypothetical protein PNK_0849 [Candidatus Protochlamydia naegleriophila]|uniref:Uncharacterized protein n=1 Tax=Candidatus Protochlamydia naegleriophila TaxID=389348 RepID=A0A0U5JCA8_9BACT|nr:hypothetical protein PNK_0849 [Candidatus Protochlamydia naegleriophila]